jgi:hypothetical protein
MTAAEIVVLVMVLVPLVGGVFVWAAVNAAVATASAIRERGDFSQFGSKPSLNDWFAPGA